jgi:hypothetical protein
VTFEKIGRHHDVPTLIEEAKDADDLAYRIFLYSGRFLGSKNRSVLVELDKAGKGEGHIAVGGFRVVGKFLVEPALTEDQYINGVLAEK